MLCNECFPPVQWNTLESVISLEGEIESIDTMMAQFAQRRASLRRKINAMSPTARIPLDILTEIFQIACQPVDNGHRQAVTPFFLGSICGLWRDIVWSTPLLWSTILLHVPRKQLGPQVQLLADWLLNARSAPLRIKLIAEDENEYVVCAFQAIMRVLVARSDYWLTFDSLLPPQCHHIFKNIKFPMLTSVSLHPPKTSISTFNSPPDMFLTSPQLLNVNLSGYNFASMVLPWAQVRRLRFKARLLSVSESLHILRQSPDLQECQLEYVYSPDNFMSKTITFHAHLKHFDVMLIKATSVLLFDSITLPSLSRLRIHYSGPEKVPLSSITSLILRSACNLERFTVEINSDDADLIPCLEAIPSLIYFHLEILGSAHRDTGLTTQLVALLDPFNNSGRFLLPNLKYFEYKGPVGCDCRPIVDMLAHRWYFPDRGTFQSTFKVSQLKLAEVLSTNQYYIAADVQEELNSLWEEGMLVRIE